MDIVTKSQINVLIQLAKVDNNLAVEETDVIYRVGHDHNYSDEEIQTIINNPQPVGTLGALSPRQKLNYLLNCIELAFADHQVLECELNFCQSIAIKMGLRKSVIDFLIENRNHLTREQLEENVFSTSYLA